MRIILLVCLSLLSARAISAQAIFPADLKLSNVDGSPGESVRFARAEGPTIVAIWATWCAPCKQELDAYATVYTKWQETYGVEIYAVSVDQGRAAKKVPGLVAEKGWPFPVLLDVEQALMSRTGIMAIPQMYIVDSEGEIVYKQKGFEPEDLAKVEAELARLKGMARG